MRVFFDQDVPHNLRHYPKPQYEVVTSANQGWKELENGALLKAVEDAGFDVMIKADQNMEYPQNLKNRRISLIVLGKGNWPIIQNHLAETVTAVDMAKPGSFTLIQMPLPPKREYKP